MLGKAPHPDQAKVLSVPQIRFVLKRGGRKRNLDTRAADIQTALRTPQLAASPAVTTTFAVAPKTLVAVIGGLSTQIAELETELASSLKQHPDADIYLALPVF